MPSNHPAIETFISQAATLKQAIRGLSTSDLTFRPPASANAGAWSIHEIIVHVMESDLICAHRMKRMLAEETPLLIAYDETAFVRELDYHAIDVLQACELFRLNREMMGGILERCSPGALERVGVHNQSGKVVLRDLVGSYINHVNHHMNYVNKKRELLGKPPV
jgi:hypothetical protein